MSNQEVSININHVCFKGVSQLNISSDVCAVCRESVFDKCNKCQQNSDIRCKCYSVMGICNHVYHQCCIKDWSNDSYYNSKKCPMCNNVWKLKERGDKPNANIDIQNNHH